MVSQAGCWIAMAAVPVGIAAAGLLVRRGNRSIRLPG
jgi:hypothetical protein